jgi:hypothetical protein
VPRELLLDALSQLPLEALPAVAMSCRAWSQLVAEGFALWLRWRRGRVVPRELTATRCPAIHNETSTRPGAEEDQDAAPARVARSIGCLGWLDTAGSALVVCCAEPLRRSVCTARILLPALRAPPLPPEPGEGHLDVQWLRRCWPFATVVGGLAGGMVGHSVRGRTAFFPSHTDEVNVVCSALSALRLCHVCSLCAICHSDSAAPQTRSSTTAVQHAEGGVMMRGRADRHLAVTQVIAVDALYQNILRAGTQVFLLRPPHLVSSWQSAQHADILELSTRRLATVDVTQLFDTFERLSSGGNPAGSTAPRVVTQAVSATSSHFVLHGACDDGSKLAAAVRLPPATHPFVRDHARTVAPLVEGTDHPLPPATGEPGPAAEPPTPPRVLEPGAESLRVVRVRAEIMGSPKCIIVGKSQSVLIMIDPMIFTHTRMSCTHGGSIG